MTSAFNPAAAVSGLLAAYKTNSPVPNTDIDTNPNSVLDAYAVQRGVVEAMGPAGGFKTSKTSDGNYIFAPILRDRIRPSGAKFGGNELFVSGVELEVAFRFIATPPSVCDPEFEPKLRRSVVAVPAIEIVDSRLASYESCSELAKLADNQWNGGLVTGAPSSDWSSLNLVDPDHRLEVGQVVLSSGKGHVADGAFAILQGFCRSVGDHCGGVKKGHLVTTGALSGVHWVSKGQHIKGQISGLGGVSVYISV
ncbi:MAG: hypothetical protein ACR2PG_10040 [Hyphomicrobiaceae bacterium]